jgi:DNA polymerase V
VGQCHQPLPRCLAVRVPRAPRQGVRADFRRTWLAQPIRNLKPPPARQTQAIVRLYCKETIDLHRLLIPVPQRCLLLPVRGDSMRGAGIQDGDLLLVERDSQPRDGVIVVAWLGDGFTVKRLRRRQGLFWLEAAHPAFPPLPLDQPGSQLWGRVIHVIRRL